MRASSSGDSKCGWMTPRMEGVSGVWRCGQDDDDDEDVVIMVSERCRVVVGVSGSSWRKGVGVVEREVLMGMVMGC